MIIYLEINSPSRHRFVAVPSKCHRKRPTTIRDVRYPGLTIVEDFCLCDGMVHRKVLDLLFSGIPYSVNVFWVCGINVRSNLGYSSLQERRQFVDRNMVEESRISSNFWAI